MLASGYTSPMRVAVVVIGDLGRSPRMLYHARALVVNGADVDLVGLRGAALPAALDRNPRVTVHTLSAARLRAGGAWSAWAYSGLALLDGARLGTSLPSSPSCVRRKPTLFCMQESACPSDARRRAACGAGATVASHHRLAQSRISDARRCGWVITTRR